MVMDALQDSTDTLASLEERITRAVEIVGALRSENQQLQQSTKTMRDELTTVSRERDEALALSSEFHKENTALTAQVKKLAQDIEEMRGERKQVKTRIEKLLGQMDLLSAS